jgi:hypothetical protein
VKKLGSYIDDEEDIENRKRLSNSVLFKLQRIWKNHQLKMHKKIEIYKCYVECILLYNCGTWATNKTLEAKINASHRRQLRTVVNIRYPKLINNTNLYGLTNLHEISKVITKRRNATLGHAFRRENAASDVLSSIIALDKTTKRQRGRRNIIKTIEAENCKLNQIFSHSLARKF